MDPKLPVNYAENLLSLEVALDEECTIEKIRNLNDYYRIGIDYYIGSQPQRAIYLQKKMTALLSDPHNLRILEKNTKKGGIKEIPSVNKSQLHHKKLKEEVSKFHNAADTCIKSMVENSDKTLDKLKELKRKDLSKQEQDLKERIMLKKARSREKVKIMENIENIPPSRFN